MNTMSNMSAPGARTGPENLQDVGRLLVSCADRPGMVAAVSDFLARRGANILSLDQYATAPRGGRLFLRTEFHLPGIDEDLDELSDDFRQGVADHLGMRMRTISAARPKRVAIMVSKFDHCLLDLLWRHRRGELPVSIEVVLSNHEVLRQQVEDFGIEFVHTPVTSARKVEAEDAQLQRLNGRVDLVVLARYMQIISGRFLDSIGCPVINIHHSFLPAFVGASPYKQAKARGVKLVGATAHYVTEELDAGPIIEQDVVRVDARAAVEDMMRAGADVERTVLARAVRWHCEDRVLIHEGLTVAF